MAFHVSDAIPPSRQPYTFEGNDVCCLVIHGFMGSPKSSRPMAEFLHAELGWTFYCPLLPGHGHLPYKLHRVSHRQWLAAAEAALATVRQRGRQIVLIGHSMGSILAAHLAVQAADIRALALIAPLHDVPSRVFHAMPLVRRLMPYLYPLRLPQIPNDVIMQRIHDFDPSIDLEDPAVKAWLPRGTRMPTSALDELRKMTRLGRKLYRKLSLPVLTLQAGADPAAPVENGEKVHAAIRAADKRYVLVAEAGHELMRPFDPAHETVWAEIRDFLRRYAG